MSAERWRRLRSIYDTIADAPASERDRLLTELCGDDLEMLAELRAMLDADNTPHAWIDDSLVARISGAFQAGDVLCERFELLRLAGRGGMGEVWAARDRQLGVDVAVKTIAASFMTGDQALARFKREIQLARRVAHRNVCRVHELLEDRGQAAPRVFLTMELLAGQTLADLLAADGTLPADQALWVFQELLDGVSAAHAEGVVHRDLKPANVMIVPGAKVPRVVIMDFGLARTTAGADPSSGASATQQPVGTPEYMAPEQLSGGDVSAATDIYALGLILFEMLSGEPPFRSPSPLESIMRRAREAPRPLAGEIAGVTPKIDAIIKRALAYDAKDRFTAVGELKAALEGSARRRSIPFPSRRFAIAAGTLALVVAGAAAYGWLRGGAAPSPAAVRSLDAAQQSLAEGAVVRARNDATRAIAEAPAFAPAHAALAEILLELEMPGRANEAIVNSAVVAPERSGLAADQQDYVSGVQALLVRDCDTALRHFEARSAGPAPDRPLRLMTTARAYERCDRPDDADRTLKAAAELDARNPAVPLRRGRLLGRRGDVDGAIAAFALAESLFRDRNNLEGVAEVFASRGAVEADKNRLEEAEATLAKAADFAATLGDTRQRIRVWLWQAVVRRKQNRLDEARALTTQAVDLASRTDLEAVALDGLFAAGNVHLTRQQLEDARALYERAMAIADSNRHDAQRARARLSLASVYVRVMEPERALAAIADARPYYERIKHARNLTNADALEGQARLMRGEYAACVERFTAVIAKARERKDAEGEALGQENLASALTGAGRLRDAVVAYEAAVRLREASKEPRRVFFARLNAADTLSRLGAFAEAEAMLPSLPESREPAPELEAQRHLILAGHLLRQGHDAAALVEADLARTLAATTPERKTRAAAAACVAAARRGDHSTAAARCEEARTIAAPTTHKAAKLDVALASAEAASLKGDAVNGRAQVEDAAGSMGAEPHEDRWRLLGLRAAIDGLEQRPAEADRAALSHELDRIRLQWGERDYARWHQRADVRRVLKAAGVNQGGTQR